MDLNNTEKYWSKQPIASTYFWTYKLYSYVLDKASLNNQINEYNDPVSFHSTLRNLTSSWLGFKLKQEKANVLCFIYPWAMFKYQLMCVCVLQSGDT